MAEESGKIQHVRSRLVRMALRGKIDDEFGKVIDTVKALEIMTTALVEEFGMTMDEVKAEAKIEGTRSMVESVVFKRAMATAGKRGEEEPWKKR